MYQGITSRKINCTSTKYTTVHASQMHFQVKHTISVRIKYLTSTNLVNAKPVITYKDKNCQR